MERCIFILIIFCFLGACKKGHKTEESSPVPGADIELVGKIKGRIVLPSGYKGNTSELQVHSPTDEASVSGNEFNIEADLDYFSSQMVFNENGDVLMIGYSYPGKTEHDIDAKSSALALIMNVEPIMMLSKESKLAMIQKVLSNQLFANLVLQVNASIVSNKDIYDIENFPLIETFVSLFNSVTSNVSIASSARTSLYRFAATSSNESGTEPLLINREGRDLNFINTRAHSSVVSIYKNKTSPPLKTFVVEGVQFVTTSISETYDAKEEEATDPIIYKYKLPNDGNYDVVVRTGLLGSDDGSIEYDQAFHENIALASTNLLGLFLPMLQPKASCSQKTIVSNAISVVSAVPDIREAKSIFSASYLGFSAIVQSIEQLIDNCGVKFNKEFLKGAAKSLNFIDKAFSFSGGVINNTIFSVHWLQSKTSMDRCYSVKSDFVEQCGNCLSPERMKLLTNDSSKTWRLLEISGFENGNKFSSITPRNGEIIPVVFRNNGEYESDFAEIGFVNNLKLYRTYSPTITNFCPDKASEKMFLNGSLRRITKLTNTILIVTTDVKDGLKTRFHYEAHY